MDPDGMKPSDRWKKGTDGSLTHVNNDGGDTMDYIDHVDQDGNVTATEEIAVETTTVDCSSCERDMTTKMPGSRFTFNAGGDPAIQEADLGDAIGEVVEAIGEELGISSTVMAAAMLIVNPKKAAKQLKKGRPRGTKHTDNRHINRSKYPNKSKYKNPSQRGKLEDRTMKTEGTKQSDGRVRYDKDFGRKVGTQGETSVRVIVDPKKNKIITSFPQKKKN